MEYHYNTPREIRSLPSPFFAFIFGVVMLGSEVPFYFMGGIGEAVVGWSLYWIVDG